MTNLNVGKCGGHRINKTPIDVEGAISSAIFFSFCNGADTSEPSPASLTPRGTNDVPNPYSLRSIQQWTSALTI